MFYLTKITRENGLIAREQLRITQIANGQEPDLPPTPGLEEGFVPGAASRYFSVVQDSAPLFTARSAASGSKSPAPSLPAPTPLSTRSDAAQYLESIVEVHPIVQLPPLVHNGPETSKTDYSPVQRPASEHSQPVVVPQLPPHPPTTSPSVKSGMSEGNNEWRQLPQPSHSQRSQQSQQEQPTYRGQLEYKPSEPCPPQEQQQQLQFYPVTEQQSQEHRTNPYIAALPQVIQQTQPPQQQRQQMPINPFAPGPSTSMGLPPPGPMNLPASYAPPGPHTHAAGNRYPPFAPAATPWPAPQTSAGPPVPPPPSTSMNGAAPRPGAPPGWVSFPHTWGTPASTPMVPAHTPLEASVRQAVHDAVGYNPSQPTPAPMVPRQYRGAYPSAATMPRRHTVMGDMGWPNPV